ncbi:MAG TPA: prephenate/arogenate dehydrogenase family protein [Alphaproteobacteria bacterium]|nr:prephenate/arogenate dehydrogenase family protein [Alphaproteobacteria bacterium]
MSGQPHFKRIAILGVGLIGSSLARVIRREGLADEVVGLTRSEASRKRILELGLVDRVEDDPAAAVERADLVVLALHLGGYEAVGAAIAPNLAQGAIVTDVGSAKRAVIDRLGQLLPEHAHLVPGHPVAGTEHSGPDAGFAELFQDRWCILTPDEGTDAAAVEKVAAMWRAGGMMVEIMDAEHHDLVLALTSHLPHAIAYTIVGTATDLESDLQSEVIKFSAGGFRDFTRIAATNPEFWRDTFLANRDAILEVLARFTEDLTALRKALRQGDGEALHEMFLRTHAIRRGIIEAGQDQAEEDKRKDG